jgi:long-chain acyl-CoA synthetase
VPLSGPPLDQPIDLRRLLRTGLETKPDEIALVSAEGGHTWRELDRASDRLAANMLELGVRRGDRVASLMPNRNALIIHYLACFKAGFVATPLNYRYMPPEIDHALEVSEASILLAHAERDQDLAASQRVSRLALGVISYGAGDRNRPSFEELVQRAPRQPDFPGPASADPAIIFFTSGSTGKPKGVTHTFETLGWLLAAWREGAETTADDIVLPGCSALAHRRLSALVRVALGRSACARRADLRWRRAAAAAARAQPDGTGDVAGGLDRLGARPCRQP